MKKKIVGLFLVVAMLVLSLASCGYNYSKDDLGQYGSFDKAGFETAIKALSIKDGDFTTDPETRTKKVTDAIYAALATAAGTTDKKTEGKLGAHDVLYYCYYVTAQNPEKAEETWTFVTDFLTNSSGTIQEKSVQLGLNLPSDLEKAVLEAFAADYDMTDNAYTKVTADDADTAEVDESKAAAGQIAYITYTYSYTEVDENGAEKEVKGTVTKARVVLDPENALHAKLIGTKIATVVEAKDDKGTAEDTKDDISYTNAKVEWVEKAAAPVEYTEEKATYTTDTKKKDVNGTERNLKDLKLTYHIFPVSYIAVAGFDAANVINEILGSKISYATLCQILFGYDFTEKTDEEKETLTSAYKFTKDGNEIALDVFVSDLANLQSTLSTAKTNLTKAETEVKTAEDKLASAQKTVTEKGENATDAEKTAVTNAQDALTVAKTSLSEKQTKYNEAKTDRDNKVAELMAKDGMADKLVKGYTDYKYEELEAAYNTAIKNALATEVYALIEKYVTINTLPEKAVDEAYKQLIENYEYAFHNNQALDSDDDGENGEASNKNESYYSLFKGSFKNFLIKCVVPNEYDKTVSTYDEAKAAIKEGAEKYVKPVLAFYIVADAYGLVIDDEEFETLADEDVNYISNEAYYGENTVRNYYQFDKLMNYVLETEETNDTTDARFTKVTYKKVTYTLKED